MAAEQAFRRLIADHIAPRLRREGFRRRAQTFGLVREGNWALVNFQKSYLSTASATRFTVNLGIVSARLAGGARATGGSVPDLQLAVWKQRIGLLLPGAPDLWWTVEESTDLDLLATQILDPVLAVGVPTLMRYLDDEALRDLWLSGSGPGLTNLARLNNLIELLKVLGPPDVLERVLAERNVASARPDAGLERALSSSGFEPVAGRDEWCLPRRAPNPGAS